MEQFIGQAKRHTYVGGGKRLLPYRLGTKDLQYYQDDWTYHNAMQEKAISSDKNGPTCDNNPSGA